MFTIRYAAREKKRIAEFVYNLLRGMVFKMKIEMKCMFFGN